MKMYRYTLVLFVAFLVAACSKNDDNQPVAKTELLLRSWQIDELKLVTGSKAAAIYKKGGSNNIQDYSKERYTFLKDGKAEYTDETGVKQAGAWKLLNSDSQIELQIGTEKQIFNIVSLSSSLLEMKQTVLVSTLDASDREFLKTFLGLVGLDANASAIDTSVRLIPE